MKQTAVLDKPSPRNGRIKKPHAGQKAAKLSTAAAVIKQIRKGLNFRELELLRTQVGIPMEELADKLSISRSTLHRRKVEGRLSPAESDKIMRFSRLLQHAMRIFGDAGRARDWLKFPQHALGGALPLDYARTEVGAREVEDLLGRIDYGVYS